MQRKGTRIPGHDQAPCSVTTPLLISRHVFFAARARTVESTRSVAVIKMWAGNEEGGTFNVSCGVRELEDSLLRWLLPAKKICDALCVCQQKFIARGNCLQVLFYKDPWRKEPSAQKVNWTVQPWTLISAAVKNEFVHFDLLEPSGRFEKVREGQNGQNSFLKAAEMSDQGCTIQSVELLSL